MKNKRFFATSFLIVLLSAVPAWAGHVVYVDFSDFDLGSWSSVNGNNPPAASDLTAIRKQVIANMSEDYATFDITITTVKPANGRYTWVKILGTDAGGLYGCAGGDCCQEGDCTGGGSWDDMTESACEVYSGSFADVSDFSGANATTARIANGISHTASHELGHVLGLSHCNAADDSITLGCDDITSNTNDQNVTWHTLASGSSWGLTTAQRATRDRFFSVHSERRILASAVQLRNHFAPLANVNGGAGLADLTYGRLSSPGTMKWYARMSNASAFGGFSEWSADAGDAGDIFLSGDVNDDGRADLVYGRTHSSTQVTWYVRLSNGSGFGGYTVWSADAGDAGDVFRLADVNGDGRADLVYGRALDSNTVRWYVRKSNGSSFGSYSTWADDAGDVGDLFFLADADDDGDADLALTDVTVLVVDDQQFTRDVVAAILRRTGAVVQTASSVREALQIFRKLEPQIVVCDIAMPDEDGYVFLREVRARPDALRRTPILALTAFGRPEDRLLALDAGFDAYLKKPVDPAELAQSVQRLSARG